MGVRFIIGRAGTGKTQRCFDRIVAAARAEPLGPPILWIVPKQATFEAERRLTLALGAFARVRVVSFELLGHEILAECGGTAVPEVTAYGRQMILSLLLRNLQPQLKFFGSSAKQPGLAAKLDATFAELERHGQTPADLITLTATDPDAQTGPDTAQRNDFLPAKLSDLNAVYNAYTTYLGQERLDPHRRLQEVLDRMEGCRLLRGATVYVDGFLDYSEYERQILCGIARTCADLEVTVLADPTAPVFSNPHLIPDELGLFHRTLSGYRRLRFALTEANVAIDAPVILERPRRFATPALKQIEAELYEIGGVMGSEFEPDGVELIEAANRRAEADAAAGRVKDLVREGYRWRDVVVLARDLGDYAETIEASFREHGIPYFVDRRRTVAHHPLVQFLRGALAILLHGWQHDAVTGLIKTGLAGLIADEADELENYVLLHRLRFGAWTTGESWEFRRVKTRGDEERDLSPEDRQAAQNADRLRRRVASPVVTLENKLKGAEPLTVRSIVVELFGLFEAFGIRQTLTDWMDRAEAAGDVEQRSEHEQVWTRLTELFDEMVELLGTEAVTLAEFADILDAGLETFDLALTPATVDQVLVGQVDRTRSAGCRAVVLLGMNEGQFPRAAREDSVLSDSERKELSTRKVELEGDTERRLLDENLYGYLAFTRASEKLILLRATGDDANKPVAPSLFWRELQGMFPKLEVRSGGDGIESISTPRQLVEGLMGWVRSKGKSAAHPRQEVSPEDDRAWAGLYQWFAKYECCDDTIDVMRYRAWRALSYDNSATLSQDVVRKLFERPLVASVSQLETFAACPFKHFVRYGLGLETRDEDDPTAIDLGNVYHETLERLVTRVLAERFDWAEIPPDVVRRLVASCTKEVAEGLRDELMMSTARNRHILAWIEKTLGKVGDWQTAAAQRGRFRPAYAELVFGRDGGKLPALVLKTPKGNEVWLRGKIDRVDVLHDPPAFAVVDYKTSDRKVELHRVLHGLSLQLLAYMLVLKEHGQSLSGKALEPAAGFYVKLLRKLEPVDHPDEALDPTDPVFPLKTKPRGIVRQDFAPSFDNQFAPGQASDVIQARVNKDGSLAAAGNDLSRNEDLAALLEYVRQKIAELADEVLAGVIEPRPYKMRTETPCPNCEYRSVCRFQPGMNRYLHVEPIGKEEVLSRIAPRATRDGGGGDDVG